MPALRKVPSVGIFIRKKIHFYEAVQIFFVNLLINIVYYDLYIDLYIHIYIPNHAIRVASYVFIVESN